MKTDEQVARYRKLRESGKSQELAAAMSSMTAKTARKYEVGPLPSQTKAPRDWRTRPDPYETWSAEEDPEVQLARVSAHSGLLRAAILTEAADVTALKTPRSSFKGGPQAA